MFCESEKKIVLIQHSHTIFKQQQQQKQNNTCTTQENLFSFLKGYHLFYVLSIVLLLKKENIFKNKKENGVHEYTQKGNNLSMKFSPGGNMDLKGAAYYSFGLCIILSVEYFNKHSNRETCYSS